MKLMDEDTVYLLTITLCSCIKKSCSFLYKQQATNNSEIGKLSADFSGKQPPMDPLRSQHNSSAKYDYILFPKGNLLDKMYRNKYGHCYHISISFPKNAYCWFFTRDCNFMRTARNCGDYHCIWSHAPLVAPLIFQYCVKKE